MVREVREQNENGQGKSGKPGFFFVKSQGNFVNLLRYKKPLFSLGIEFITRILKFFACGAIKFSHKNSQLNYYFYKSQGNFLKMVRESQGFFLKSSRHPVYAFEQDINTSFCI